MVRGAMNNEHLFGPYFFDGPLNHLNYLTMLEKWFIPQLQSLGIEIYIIWFQQDGVPVHFAITVRKYLKEVFPRYWIGIESAILSVSHDRLP